MFSKMKTLAGKQCPINKIPFTKNTTNGTKSPTLTRSPACFVIQHYLFNLIISSKIGGQSSEGVRPLDVQAKATRPANYYKNYYNNYIIQVKARSRYAGVPQRKAELN